MYCGCRGCPAKTLWAIFTILLLGGIALLAGGLVRTVPCTTDLVNCEKGLAKGSQQHTVCWDTFWTCTSGVARGIFFIISVVGAAAILLSLLTLCCFCCVKRPGARARKVKKGSQFVEGEAATAGAAGYGAPNAYDAPGTVGAVDAVNKPVSGTALV